MHSIALVLKLPCGIFMLVILSTMPSARGYNGSNLVKVALIMTRRRIFSPNEGTKKLVLHT